MAYQPVKAGPEPDIIMEAPHDDDKLRLSSSKTQQSLAGGERDKAVKNLFKIDSFTVFYFSMVVVYFLAAIAALVWTLTGARLDQGAEMRRVFRVGDVPVNGFYSGIIQSALFALAGLFIQWLLQDFRKLHLFSLTTQSPVKVSDLDAIGDYSSFWTLLTVFRYSWWYGLMQITMLFIRTCTVPVGALVLTVGLYKRPVSSTGIIGIPALLADTNTYTGNAMEGLSTAMGGIWDEQGFRPSLASNDSFLSFIVTTYVGSMVSQSGLVNVNSGLIGPVSTHNITFRPNTTYDGLVFFEWDAHCEPALEVPYTVHSNGSYSMYNFAFPDGDYRQLRLTPEKGGSRGLELWSNPSNEKINGLPITGTTYFLSVSDSVSILDTTSLDRETLPKSITETEDGNFVSRTKCTPSFAWHIGQCTFNGTAMTTCYSNPGSNTTALDTDALDALGIYMTGVAFYLWKQQSDTFDNMLDTLYSLPTSDDWGHFFGTLAYSIASISTAGYYGTATVPSLEIVAQEVYVVRASVLITITVMFGLIVALTIIDFTRSYTRGLPFHHVSFMAAAQATRGPLWEDVFRDMHLWRESESKKHTGTRVKFGLDMSDDRYIRLASEVVPAKRANASDKNIIA